MYIYYMYDDFFTDFKEEIEFTINQYNSFLLEGNRAYWKHNINYSLVSYSEDKEDIIYDKEIIPYGPNRNNSGKECIFPDAFEVVLLYVPKGKWGGFIDMESYSSIITSIYVPEDIPIKIKFAELIVYDSMKDMFNVNNLSELLDKSKFTELDVKDIAIENILSMTKKIGDHEIHKFGIEYFYKDEIKYVRHVFMKPYCPELNGNIHIESPTDIDHIDFDYYIEYIKESYDNYINFDKTIYYNNNYILKKWPKNYIENEKLKEVPEEYVFGSYDMIKDFEEEYRTDKKYYNKVDFDKLLGKYEKIYY